MDSNICIFPLWQIQNIICWFKLLKMGIISLINIKSKNLKMQSLKRVKIVLILDSYDEMKSDCI